MFKNGELEGCPLERVEGRQPFSRSDPPYSNHERPQPLGIDELLLLVDEDTAAFKKVIDAFALPKESAEEKAARSAAIEAATKYAAEVPLKVMETASKSYQLLSEMVEKGNPNSISDVGVGALATRACVEGAALNVRINLGQLKDEKFKSALVEKVRKISADSDAQFQKINQVVESKLG